jgi:carbonic anhydrase/acetyltransferase-like protein (isoleucine patch superfamily)
MKRPRIDPTAYIAPGARVLGDVLIRKNASIWHNAVLRGDVDAIIIGSGSNVQDNCTLHCSRGAPTVLHENVTVGHNAVLHSCEVGAGSLIGMGAIVLDGAVIGCGCLVAAGSVVTPRTVIPDGSLVMGSPARVKRALLPQEIESLADNAREYLALAADARAAENGADS